MRPDGLTTEELKRYDTNELRFEFQPINAHETKVVPYKGGKRIGEFVVAHKDGKKKAAVTWATVSPEYRRQGIATQAFDEIERKFGPLRAGTNGFLPDGKAFWDARQAKKTLGDSVAALPRRIGISMEPDGAFEPPTNYRSPWDDKLPKLMAPEVLDRALRQKGLTRPTFPKTTEQDLQRVQEITAKALRSPAGERVFEAGSKVPGAPDWYNTDQMRQMAGEVLGEQGDEAVDHLMKMMAATTALGTPRSNLKRASLWHSLGVDGFDPSKLMTGEKLAVPEKFGHFTQSSQQPAIARVMATGEIDPALGPKQASFAENLTRNWRPATLDVWMARLLRDIAPDLEKTRTIKSSLTNKEYGSTAEAINPRHYAPVERALQDYAGEQRQAGRINVPAGYDPTAPTQSVLWHGVNPLAAKNPQTLQQTFEDLLKSSAGVWGTDLTGANKLFWQGQPFELPLGSRLLR